MKDEQNFVEAYCELLDKLNDCLSELNDSLDKLVANIKDNDVDSEG